MKKILSILLGICLIAIAMPGVKAEAEEVSPKLIVESYAIEGEYDIGGETTIKLVLKNMSDTHTMTDVMLSFTSDNSVIPALGTSNQVFVEKIEAGKTVDVEYKVAIVSSTNGYARMSFAASYAFGAVTTYENKDGKKVTEYLNMGSYSNSNSYIIFPVVTTTSFMVNSVNVANSTTVGAKAIVGLRYSNTGKDTVKNVTMLVSYDDKTEAVEMGDIKQETTNYLEHYITFDSTGTKSVSIVIQYENSAGKTESIVVGKYNVDVKSASIPATPTPMPGADDNNTSLLSDPTFTIILVVIGIIVVSGLFGLLSVRRRKK